MALSALSQTIVKQAVNTHCGKYSDNELFCLSYGSHLNCGATHCLTLMLIYVFWENIILLLFLEVRAWSCSTFSPNLCRTWSWLMDAKLNSIIRPFQINPKLLAYSLQDKHKLMCFTMKKLESLVTLTFHVIFTTLEDWHLFKKSRYVSKTLILCRNTQILNSFS